MSSTFLRRPDFRLHLGYPEVTLLRSDVPGMVRLASPDHPAFSDDLRRLAAAVDASNGRLTVILPDREVWRDRRRLAARTPWTRRREARDLASRALAVAPGEIALSVGRRGSDGSTPLAATRRQTLVEVRRMLAAVGLRAEVIRGAGRFDGFATPPALGNLRWNPVGRRIPTRVPGAAMAMGGLAAAIAAVVGILAAGSPEPIMSHGPLVHQSVARAPMQLAEAVSVAPAPARLARPATVAKAAPPPGRPDAALPAPAAPPLFSVNTRNLDLSAGKDGQPVLKLRDLPGARSLAVEPGVAPMPRPQVAREVAKAVEAPGAKPLLVDRPLARPVAQPLAEKKPTLEPVAEIVRQVAAADTEDFVRPEHRPLQAPSVRVASLTPADAVVGALAAATLAPLARPDSVGAVIPPAVPAPRQAAKVAAPKLAAPQPTPVRKTVAITAPAPKLQRAATAGAVAARPVAPSVIAPVAPATTARPVVTAALLPQPKIVPVTPTPKIARVAAASKPAPVASTAPSTRNSTRSQPRFGMSGGKLTLIGVFGDTDRPHALVRLPNGDIERVRTGDSLGGLQVASVTSDGVRMRSGTDVTMLRLPD